MKDALYYTLLHEKCEEFGYYDEPERDVDTWTYYELVIDGESWDMLDTNEEVVEWVDELLMSGEIAPDADILIREIVEVREW